MSQRSLDQNHIDYIIDTDSGNHKMASMHYHASYEMYYLEMGSREYFVEEKLFSVSAGDFVLIPPGMLHRTGGEYGVRTLVGFTREFLEKTYTNDTVEFLLRCFEHLKVTPTQSQQGTCKSLLKKMAACKEDTEFAVMLGMLLTELSKCRNEDIQDGYVSMIVAYINKNYTHITNLNQIADHFFISKYHLCRVFKSAMKVTIIEYLNQVRIKNACQLLDFSDSDIGDISEACGYNSVAYFSNVFKKVTGYSPSEYRKENRRSMESGKRS